MRRSILALSALVLVAGCGGPDELNATTNTTSKTEEVPVSPKGIVSGQVLTLSLAPIAEADVTLTLEATPRTTRTAADGTFAFAGVTAGSTVLLTVQKPGFAILRTRASVPAAAGDFPLANGVASVGPIQLAELDQSISFLVLDPSGLPVSGARALVEASPAGSVFGGTGLSAAYGEATVDGSGRLVFTGMPGADELVRLGGRYRVWVSAVDANADGFPEFEGVERSFTPAELVDGDPRVITLARAMDAGGNFKVEGGNVGSFLDQKAPAQNLVPAGEPLRLVFNEPLDLASVLVQVTDEYASELIPTQVTLGGAGNVLLLAPQQSLAVGAEGNVSLRVQSRTGKAFSKTAFFFVGSPAAPKEIGIAAIRYQETSTDLPSRLNDGERVYVEFNQPLAREGSGSHVVEAFFAVDINGDNRVGGATVGEVGNSTGRGFELQADEPIRPVATRDPAEQAVFPITKSGYTTRYSFSFRGAATLDPGLVSITVSFDALRGRTSDVYETVWGVPVTTALTSGIRGIPAVPSAD